LVIRKYDQFLTRARVLSLYRDIQRTLKGVKDPRDRQELQQWARSDFERFRHEKNPVCCLFFFFSFIRVAPSPPQKQNKKKETIQTNMDGDGVHY